MTEDRMERQFGVVIGKLDGVMSYQKELHEEQRELASKVDDVRSNQVVLMEGEKATRGDIEKIGERVSSLEGKEQRRDRRDAWQRGAFWVLGTLWALIIGLAMFFKEKLTALLG